MKNLSDAKDTAGMQALKAAVDAQLAIAELKIKVREADWPKLTAWGPLVAPMLGAILGAIVGTLIKR